MKTPDLSDVIAMSSMGRARFLDGKLYLAENTTSEALPYFHFADVIPGAKSDVGLITKGEPFQYKGTGGMSQLWAAFSWLTCL